jgi:hypothetical protein
MPAVKTQYNCHRSFPFNSSCVQLRSAHKNDCKKFTEVIRSATVKIQLYFMPTVLRLMTWFISVRQPPYALTWLHHLCQHLICYSCCIRSPVIDVLVNIRWRHDTIVRWNTPCRLFIRPSIGLSFCVQMTLTAEPVIATEWIFVAEIQFTKVDQHD